jgi:hypothetical protein
MNSRQVRETIRLLSPDSPVYRPDPNRSRRRNGKEDPMRTAGRWSEGMTAPNWGWRVAYSYFIERKPLPPTIQNPAIRRAYYFLHGQDDENLAIVVSLFLPGNSDRRIVLQGLLCAKDITLSGIAHLLGLHPDVIELYESLFFNVRGRDSLYLATAIFPSTRLLAIKDAETGPTLTASMMMQMGRDFGWKAVARMAGIIPVVDSDNSTDRQVEELERHIAGNAMMLAQAGYLNRPNSAGLQHVKSLMRVRKEQEPEKPWNERDHLSDMSMSMSVNDSFKRLVMPDLARRLAFQRGIATEEAKAASGKT